MTDEQKKLKELVEKLETATKTIQKLRADEKKAVEFSLKLQGAIEAFELLGIKLPTEEEDGSSS